MRPSWPVLELNSVDSWLPFLKRTISFVWNDQSVKMSKQQASL